MVPAPGALLSLLAGAYRLSSFLAALSPSTSDPVGGNLKTISEIRMTDAGSSRSIR
jgi:hypothetical protein